MREPHNRQKQAVDEPARDLDTQCLVGNLRERYGIASCGANSPMEDDGINEGSDDDLRDCTGLRIDAAPSTSLCAMLDASRTAARLQDARADWRG